MLGIWDHNVRIYSGPYSNRRMQAPGPLSPGPASSPAFTSKGQAGGVAGWWEGLPGMHQSGSLNKESVHTTHSGNPRKGYLI